MANSTLIINGTKYETPLNENESALYTPYYTIVWSPKDEYWIDVKVFARATFGDKREYMKGEDITEGLTPDWTQAQPMIEGFVKWDGCMQLELPEGIHCDGEDDVKRFSDLFPLIYDRACEMNGKVIANARKQNFAEHRLHQRQR